MALVPPIIPSDRLDSIFRDLDPASALSTFRMFMHMTFDRFSTDSFFNHETGLLYLPLIAEAEIPPVWYTLQLHAYLPHIRRLQQDWQVPKEIMIRLECFTPQPGGFTPLPISLIHTIIQGLSPAELTLTIFQPSALATAIPHDGTVLLQQRTLFTTYLQHCRSLSSYEVRVLSPQPYEQVAYSDGDTSLLVT